MKSALWTDRAFASVLRAGDSRRYKINIKDNRQEIIAKAIEFGQSTSPKFGPIYKSKINEKICHSIKDYSQILTLRVLAKYIARRLPKTKPTRDRVVESVIQSLGDSVPMHIARRDIKSFYESIPIKDLTDILYTGPYLPKSLKIHTKSFFSEFENTTGMGIPRGTPLSPILAEIALLEFDRKIRLIEGVYGYFRYADDILIFSYKPIEVIDSEINEALPKCMQFNASKSDNIALCQPKKKSSVLRRFEYLGYEYAVNDYSASPHAREVAVSIARKKINRLKSRIILSLKQHKRKPDFHLLVERIKFLSGNYVVQRKGVNSVKSSVEVKSGIFYNYKLCGKYTSSGQKQHDCNELKGIDGFFYALIKPHTDLGSLLSNVERKTLSEISFAKGYELKFHEKFNGEKLLKIKGAWRNA